MYEKLCAVLDALRGYGATVKAELDLSAGCWDFVGQIRLYDGNYKLFRVPLTISYLKHMPAESCIKTVCGEVYQWPAM